MKQEDWNDLMYLAQEKNKSSWGKAVLEKIGMKDLKYCFALWSSTELKHKKATVDRLKIN